jgi:pyruvate dehydrogenase complex dehydrogenase (E1) component
VTAVLSALAADGIVDYATVKDAIARYDLDPDTPDPRTR